MTNEIETADRATLIIGGNGKTGRRVAERLWGAGRAVRLGSRSQTPAFDWEDRGTWAGALDGMGAAYVTYFPDLLMPEAEERVGAFAKLAVDRGVRRLVLLSGRGEPAAQRAEEALKASGADWTIVRASWFAQNFSESLLADLIGSGEVALPVGPVGEPFIDADDIAEVVTESLLDDRHIGQLYEVTGSRLITFEQALAEIAAASGRPIRFVRITPAEFREGLLAAGLPAPMCAMLMELFTEVLDGRNASVTDAVQRVTGRPARDFSDYVREAVTRGMWRQAA